MDLTVMRYVVSVADTGNFSQAAGACFVGQPALSQLIARLEKELGVKLFFRNPRGAVPTEAGKEFVRRAREILKHTEELSEQMSAYAGLHKGSLTLGLITSLQCIEFGSMLSAFVHTYPDITFSDGAVLTKAAFSKIPYVGTPVLTFGLLTFTFSTILGWSYYGERSIEYLKGPKWVTGYRIVYIFAIFAGSVLNLELVWDVADCMNALMAIPNLISLLALSGIIVHETQKYLWSNRLDDEM